MWSAIAMCFDCVSCPEVRTTVGLSLRRDVRFIPPNQLSVVPIRSGPVWSRAGPGGGWKANSVQASTRAHWCKSTLPGKSRASCHAPFQHCGAFETRFNVVLHAVGERPAHTVPCREEREGVHTQRGALRLPNLNGWSRYPLLRHRLFSLLEGAHRRCGRPSSHI